MFWFFGRGKFTSNSLIVPFISFPKVWRSNRDGILLSEAGYTEVELREVQIPTHGKGAGCTRAHDAKLPIDEIARTSDRGSTKLLRHPRGVTGLHLTRILSRLLQAAPVQVPGIEDPQVKPRSGVSQWTQ